MAWETPVRVIPLSHKLTLFTPIHHTHLQLNDSKKYKTKGLAPERKAPSGLGIQKARHAITNAKP